MLYLLIDYHTYVKLNEVADELKLTPTYLIKLGKKIKLSEAEMREAGNRNYLFSEEAVQKLKNAKQQK